MNLLKRCFLVFVIILIGSRVYGQAKGITVAQDAESWYKNETDLTRKLKLPDLRITHDGVHWRFWYTKSIASAMAIDINSMDSLNCNAFITLYTIEQVGENEKPTNRVYSKKLILSADNAARLFKLTHDLDIRQFKTRDTVKGKIMHYETLDAAPYIVEYADNTRYAFKTCLMPVGSKAIKTFLDATDTLADFKKLNTKFEKTILYEFYYGGGMEGWRKILTNSQKKRYKKERDKYRKQNNTVGPDL